MIPFSIYFSQKYQRQIDTKKQSPKSMSLAQLFLLQKLNKRHLAYVAYFYLTVLKCIESVFDKLSKLSKLSILLVIFCGDFSNGFFEDHDVKVAQELETSLNINLSRPPDAFMHSSRHDKKLQPNPSQNLFFSLLPD